MAIKRFIFALLLILGASARADDDDARLSSLAILGPAEVNESSTASYSARATFSDGSTRTVTTRAVWSENSAYARISGGVLTTTAVAANQAVRITASYRSNEVTRTAYRDVTIRDGAATRSLSSLSIQGPASVAENSTATYTAVAGFSDGSSQTVTDSATWGENSNYASINAGVLTAAAVTGNQTVAVTASYTTGGVTRTASRSVTIQDAAAPATLS